MELGNVPRKSGLCTQGAHLPEVMAACEVHGTACLWFVRTICKTLCTLGRHQPFLASRTITAAYCTWLVIQDDRLACCHVQCIGSAFEFLLAFLFIRWRRAERWSPVSQCASNLKSDLGISIVSRRMQHRLSLVNALMIWSFFSGAAHLSCGVTWLVSTLDSSVFCD